METARTEGLTVDWALAQLLAGAVEGKAAEMEAYHKAPRRYLGVANPVIDALTKSWRKQVSLEQRLALAAGLRDTDIHEARIAAAKLLTQARIRPEDAGAWRLIAGWVPECDAWAIAPCLYRRAETSGGGPVAAGRDRGMDPGADAVSDPDPDARSVVAPEAPTPG